MKRVVLLMGLVGVVGLGCAERRSYNYAPAEGASASIAGRPASVYALPGNTGTVRIATFGLATVRQDDPIGGVSMTAMHVRMEVINRSATPMTVDTRQQVAYLGRYGISQPALSAAYGSTTPIVTVPPGQARAIELFYPMPEPLIGSQLVPRFHIDWNVQTGSGRMNARANFDRIVL